jgi:hypothetical protein
MAALHEALKTLSPIDFSTVPVDDLKPFLSETFSDAQLLIDSVPIPGPAEDSLTVSIGRSRSNTIPSIASSSSDISLSTARPSPPPPEIESLQTQWGNPLRLNTKDNPLGINVYKLAGKDGKGAWFARRSVHEGLGFERWKKALEKEFPETMKVQGGPGEGKIRGIGGERRVEHKVVDGIGKLEGEMVASMHGNPAWVLIKRLVYHLSAQFPGPTTPRDFVTLLLTSDTALKENCGGLSENREIPRHFMVVSKPCIHPDCPERDGFIRGQYQSVEFIRELPVKKARRSASTANLLEKDTSQKRADSSSLGKEAILRSAKKFQPQQSIGGEDAGHDVPVVATSSETNLSVPVGRQRGKTISFSQSRGWDEQEADEAESNPVEWIMLTRSDPGGSVPRFMVERGTPSSIVADASKFLDWACSSNMDAEDEPIPEQVEGSPVTEGRRSYEKPLHDYQMNGHLAGLDGSRDPPPTERQWEAAVGEDESAKEASSGIFGMVTGAMGAAGAMVAAHTPAVITNRLPGHVTTSAEVTHENRTSTRRLSTSSSDSGSSGSFVSAYERNEDDFPAVTADNLSTKSESSFVRNRPTLQQEKELLRLEDRKRRLNEKLAKTREKELSKKSEDSEREAQAIARAEEKHQREIAKQEEKYKREMAKLEAKREREEKKAEEKRRKALEKDDRARMSRELEEVKAERDILKVERDLLRKAMAELQAENTALAARVGKLGATGEAVLRDVREEISSGGRLRAASLRGLGSGSSKTSSVRSVDIGNLQKENLPH